MKDNFRVRGVYGKPWSRLVSEPVHMDRKVLDRLGQVLVDAVVEEARVDFAKQRKSAKAPEGIPDSKDFFDSFSYRIVGRSTVEVVSSWPWIEQITEGRPPYPMTWLTRPRGVGVVPIIREGGTVVLRATPLTLDGAWIHPGFAKHTFVQRGIRKGRVRAAKIVAEEAVKILLAGDPFR